MSPPLAPLPTIAMRSLQAAARYYYVTTSILQLIGVSNNAQSLRRSIRNHLTDRSSPLLRRIPYSIEAQSGTGRERREDLLVITGAGAARVAYEYGEDKKYFPFPANPTRLTHDYDHRVATVKALALLDKHAAANDVTFVHYPYYLPKWDHEPFLYKKAYTVASQNKAIVPDAIIKCYKNGKVDQILILEIHNTQNLEDIKNQIDGNIDLIADMQINKRLNANVSNTILSISNDTKDLEKIYKKITTISSYREFIDHILFADLEMIRNGIVCNGHFQEQKIDNSL